MYDEFTTPIGQPKSLIKDWLKEHTRVNGGGYRYHFTESELHELCLKVAEQQRKICLDECVTFQYNEELYNKILNAKPPEL